MYIYIYIYTYIYVYILCVGVFKYQYVRKEATYLQGILTKYRSPIAWLHVHIIPLYYIVYGRYQEHTLNI